MDLGKSRAPGMAAIKQVCLSASLLMSIPRIIHQTWKSADIPSVYQEYVDSVRSINPTYNYKLWTDIENREFIASYYPWFLEKFDAYRHNIERADAVRYFLLYKFGGVYIDLDMECMRPIDELLTNGEVILSVEAGPLITQKIVSNAFMAAAPGHPFFLDIINTLASNKRPDITFQDVFEITGPNMVMSRYLSMHDRYRFRILKLDEICPVGVMGQYPFFQGVSQDEIRQQKKLVMIHHNTESWNLQADCQGIDVPGFTLFRDMDINGCVPYCPPFSKCSKAS